MERKSLLNQDVFDSCLERINNFTPESKALWSKINAGQMLAHCTEVQVLANGKAMLGQALLIARFLKEMIKKIVMSKKPLQKSLDTHLQFIHNEVESLECLPINLVCIG